MFIQYIVPHIAIDNLTQNQSKRCALIALHGSLMRAQD